MSVAGPPTPEADLSTAAEQQERSNQAFLAALDLRDKIQNCVLFPPEFDLDKACPCGECAYKIAKLKEFEIEIKSKKQLVMKHWAQFDKNELRCLKLSSAGWWTKRMFDIFHNELKAVSEESGVALTHEKIVLYMQQMLEKCGIVCAPEEGDEEPYVADDKHCDIFDEIDTGRFYYGETKAKDTANGLLTEIAHIEEYHDKEKKSALAEKKAVDLSISKKCIVKQIELVNELPVEKLKHEFDELISVIHPRREHKARNGKAIEYISNTCCVIIKKMKEFWKQTPNGNEHISDGWGLLFDSLINEVKSFDEGWKKNYALIYTPHDRTNRK